MGEAGGGEHRTRASRMDEQERNKMAMGNLSQILETTADASRLEE